jgi:hypothetical protein
MISTFVGVIWFHLPINELISLSVLLISLVLAATGVFSNSMKDSIAGE